MDVFESPGNQQVVSLSPDSEPHNAQAVWVNMTVSCTVKPKLQTAVCWRNNFYLEEIIKFNQITPEHDESTCVFAFQCCLLSESGAEQEK